MEETYIPTEQEQQEAFELFEAAKALPTLAEKRDLFRQSVRDQILNGYMNPLEFYRQAKIVADVIDELKKDPDILDCAQTERLKFGKEKPVVNGAVVDTGSKTTYDYESTGDPVYQELKKKLKDREAFLKAIPAGGIIDPETGQLLMPPVQKISNFITVKV